MKIRNTFIIFIVSGFWHGANWTFIVWGALNAIYFKLGLIVIITIVIIYAIVSFFPFHYFNHEYPMWVSKTEIIESRHPYGNIIIGDSRAIAAFVPEILGPSYYNLALGGGTPIEGYYILKRTLNNQNKIDTLIISFSPFHFEKADSFWDRSLKFGFLKFENINEIFLELNESNRMFWNFKYSTMNYIDFNTYFLQAYLNRIKFPTSVRSELANSTLMRGETNKQVYQDITKQRGYYPFGKGEVSHRLNSEAQRKTFTPKIIMIISLHKIFKLAEENGVKVIYQATPMNKSSYNNLKPNYVNDYHTLIKSFIDEYDWVEFRADIFYYEDTFFGDPSHLNSRGAIKFSEEIKHRLNY